MSLNSSLLEPWYVNFSSEILQMTKSSLKKWCSLIDRLGLQEEKRTEWISIYKRELGDVLNDLVKEVSETTKSLMNKIEIHLKHSEQLCKELRISMPHHGAHNYGLFEEEKLLKAQVAKLEEKVDKRLAQLDALRCRQQEICTYLEREGFEIQDYPLPSIEELTSFKTHIELLETERDERRKQFRTTKKEIKKLMADLRVKPMTNFENSVLTKDEHTFVLSDPNMLKLENFYEALSVQMHNTKYEIDSLKEQVAILWGILEEPEDCERFLQTFNGYNFDVLEALKKELARCEGMKKKNFEVYIKKIRTKLVNTWDKCKVSEEERSKFKDFKQVTYTEDLLNSHEIEIGKWKKHYEEYREMYELLQEREDLVSKKLELEEHAHTPSRFKNRGGQLLREERERNLISKKIPKIEEQLLAMAVKYEARTGETFLYWGESVQTIIQRSRKIHENENKMKCNTKKLLQRNQSLTPRKILESPNLTYTPLKTSNTNLARGTPKSGMMKRKLATPILSAKKNKLA